MRKIIIFLVSILFFTTIFMTNNTVKAEIIFFGGFDGVASGLDTGTEGYMSWKNMGTANYFETSTDYDLTSPNSLMVKGYNLNNGDGYLNLTTSFSYIGEINFSFYEDHMSGTNDFIDIYFKDSSGNSVITIQFKGTDSLNWYGISSGYHTIYSISADTRYYLLINHNGTNQFNINLLDASFAVLANLDYEGSYADDFTNFSYIYFDVTTIASQDVIVYFDNFYIDTSGGEGTGYTEFFCNGVPNTFLTEPDFIGQRYIESRFMDWTGTGLTGKIINVQLPISPEQYNQVASNPENYKCWVNGVYFGIGDNMSSYDDFFSCYWVTWDTYSIDITNDFPLFVFGCNVSGVLGYYWFGVPSYLCSPNPLKYHNTTTLCNNLVQDGTAYYVDAYNVDITYCFTLENFEYGEPEPPETPDEFIKATLFFNFYDAKTGTKLQTIELEHYHDLFTSFTEEDSFCAIQLSVTAISNGGNETHICPLLEDSYGSNEVAIYRNVHIAPFTDNIIDFMGSSSGNIYGHVDGKGVLWYRYIKTLILAPFGTYDIYLTRLGEKNNTEPIPPIILPDHIDKYGDFFLEWLINDDFTDNCYYRVGENPTLIYYLDDSNYSDVNGYIWEMKDSNNLTVTTGKIYFTTTNESGYIPVTWFKFAKEGEYQLLLYNITVGNKKDEIVYISDTITVCKGQGGGETPIFGIIIPEWAKYIIAIIIILIVTISPLLLGIMIAKGHDLPEIPSLVYVAFFFLGLISCVLINLISVIVPIIILIGLILGFAIMWLSGKQGE